MIISFHKDLDIAPYRKYCAFSVPGTITTNKKKFNEHNFLITQCFWDLQCSIKGSTKWNDRIIPSLHISSTWDIRERTLCQQRMMYSGPNMWALNVIHLGNVEMRLSIQNTFLSFAAPTWGCITDQRKGCHSARRHTQGLKYIMALRF